MSEIGIWHMFVKECETYRVSWDRLTECPITGHMDGIVRKWNDINVFVRFLIQCEQEPTLEEQHELMQRYNCSEFAVCRDNTDIKNLLRPIGEEIYIESGEKARYEQRQKEHKERMAREHRTAVDRKAERQRQHELRREKQLEKARLYHLEHGEEKINSQDKQC